MSSRLTFRLARPDEAESISRFNFESGRGYYDPAYWRWKYFDNPWGRSALAVAMDGERIVGQQGVFALPMSVSGAVVMAYQSTDNAILETHRAGNVYFSLIATLWNEVLIESKEAFVFGIAADVTRESSELFLGYETVAPLRKLVRVVNPGPHLRRRLALPFAHLAALPFASIVRFRAGRALRRVSADADVTRVAELDERYDALWKESPKAAITVSKHRRYLDWRFFECPVPYQVYALEKEGTLLGFVAVHLHEEEGIQYGVLDELVARKEDVDLYDRLVTMAVGVLVDQGADAVVCWQRSGTGLDARLGRAGFIARNPPRTLIVREGDAAYPDGFLGCETKWSYMIADSDYWIFPRERT